MTEARRVSVMDRDALVALRRLKTQAPELAHPGLFEDPETVDHASSRTSAIYAPVNRDRRSAAVASIVCSWVRLAATLGDDDRSTKPTAPSRR